MVFKFSVKAAAEGFETKKLVQDKILSKYRIENKRAHVSVGEYFFLSNRRRGSNYRNS